MGKIRNKRHNMGIKSEKLIESKLENIEVMLVDKQDNCRIDFADINHKISFGANNWEKFLKSMPPKNSTFKRDANLKTQHRPVEHRPNLNRALKGKKKAVNAFSNKISGDLQPTKVGNLGRKMNRPTDVTSSESVNQSLNGPGAQNVSTPTESKVDQITQPCHVKANNLTKQIAIDCEMVGVEIGVNKSMLARVSLVNAHGDCIYDKYVEPTEPVLDYRTHVSGIRPKDLINATDFKSVQTEVAEIIKGRILIGHALKNDLSVLFLSHPRRAIRDTSKYKTFREGKSPALRKLAQKYLGVSIQDGEHSSIQDALAAMQLYRMFRKEWESSLWIKKCEKPLRVKEDLGGVMEKI